MSERGEVKRDSAKAIKNSGRGSHQKGDAVWFDFVVDYKEYPKGFRVTPENWAKICTDAMRTDRSKSPALKIIMGEGSDIIRLAVIEWGYLADLMHRMKAAEEDIAYWQDMAWKLEDEINGRL